MQLRAGFWLGGVRQLVLQVEDMVANQAYQPQLRRQSHHSIIPPEQAVGQAKTVKSMEVLQEDGNHMVEMFKFRKNYIILKIVQSTKTQPYYQNGKISELPWCS